jgi:hypothetical protein
MNELLEKLLEQDEGDFEDLFAGEPSGTTYIRVEKKYDEDDDFRYEVQVEAEQEIENMSLDELDELFDEFEDCAIGTLAIYFIENKLITDQGKKWMINHYIETVM